MKLSELHALTKNLCSLGYGCLEVRLGSIHKLGNKADVSERISMTDEGGIEHTGTITFEIDYVDMEERTEKTIE